METFYDCNDDCVDGQEFQGEDPGDGGGARAAKQPPADQRPGDLCLYMPLKSQLPSMKRSCSHISFICASVQEISDLDDHIAILK